MKWIIKGEIIQLCLTKWWIISGTSRYWVSIRRYCLVLGGTGSVKTGTAWYYMVQGQHRACMPVYIGKSGDLVGWHRCLTYSQTTEYRATQLVSSIKHKLSHAMMLMILAMVIVCGQSGHFCSNDHDLMDYMDEIAQVVSINCSVSANPSNDLVFRFQSFAKICLSRRS